MPTPHLSAAAAAARRRVMMARWCRVQRAATPWWLGVLVLAVGSRLVGGGVPMWCAYGVFLWFIASAWWIGRRPVSTSAALAAWDRAAGLDDLLLNAWDFSVRGESGAFARVHIERTLARLEALRADLPRHLPVRVPYAAVALPVLAAALIGSGLFVPPVADGDQALAATERERLAQQTAALVQAVDRLPTAALDKAEQERLDDLRKRIRAAQEQAAKDGLGRNETLRELDRLARQAEALASQLMQDGAPSAELLAELARHADTAELAAALAAADAAKAAREAEALAARLARADLTLDEQRRLAQALERADARSDRSAAGQAISQANAGMRGGNRSAASASLRHLSQQLNRTAQRQAAARQVGALAGQLRSGGGRMLNTAPTGTAKPVQLANLPPIRIPPGAKPGSGSGMARPATGNPPPGGAAGRAPVPGTASGRAPGSGTCPVPGTGVAGAGAGAGAMAGAMPGGSQAGRGHVDATQTATRPLASTTTSTVDAAMGSGDSEQRAVAGQAHQESASAASATPMAVVDAEERALDADPLPASRREQVKTYFTLLRDQLEK